MIGNDINIFIRRTMNESQYFTMREEEKQKERERLWEMEHENVKQGEGGSERVR